MLTCALQYLGRKSPEPYVQEDAEDFGLDAISLLSAFVLSLASSRRSWQECGLFSRSTAFVRFVAGRSSREFREFIFSLFLFQETRASLI
jgi:hypothetical protein